MQCNRKTAILASMGFGGILAVSALNAAAPETPLAGRAARGFGGIINTMVETLGPTGAAITFVVIGAIMAIVSAAMCPSARR